MTQFMFRQEAGPGIRYAPGAWDSAVGTPVAVEGGESGRIVAVQVVEGGAAVEFLVEADLPGFDPLRDISLGTDE